MFGNFFCPKVDKNKQPSLNDKTKQPSLLKQWQETCIRPFHSPLRSTETSRLIQVIKKNDKPNDIRCLHAILTAIDVWLRNRPQSQRKNLVENFRLQINDRIEKLKDENTKTDEAFFPHCNPKPMETMCVLPKDLEERIGQGYIALLEDYKHIHEMIGDKKFTNLKRASQADRTRLYTNINTILENIKYITQQNQTMNPKKLDSIQLSTLGLYCNNLNSWLEGIEEISQAKQERSPRFQYDMRRFKSFAFLPFSFLMDVDMFDMLDPFFTLCTSGLF